MHPQLIVRVSADSIQPPDGYFVGTNGRWGASGSLFDPMSLEYAISASAPMASGDDCWILGGNYIASTAGVIGGANSPGLGAFTIETTGINYRNFPGHWVRINGGIEIMAGTGGTLRGLEIASTPTTRVFGATPGIPSIYITVPGWSLIDNYIHDLANVYIYPASAGTTLLHGNLIGWNGWYDGAQNRGTGIYGHSHAGGPVYCDKNCFVYQMGRSNIDIQSAGATNVRDYYIRDNFSVGRWIYLGSSSGYGDNNSILRNYGWETSLVVQAYDNAHVSSGEDALVNDNYIVNSTPAAMSYSYTRNANIQNNTFITRSQNHYAALHYAPTSPIVSVTVDYNTYLHPVVLFEFLYGGGNVTWANWKLNTGWDANSTFSTSLPTVNVVKKIKSDYSERGFIAIYNWENLTSVLVDISDFGFSHGAACIYRNAVNPDEYVLFNYNADYPYLSIPMTAASWTLRQPTAYDAPPAWPSEPFPAYGAFLIEKR